MNRNTPGKILFAFGLVTALAGCSSPTTVAPEVVPLGNDTYSITRAASNGFTRDTGILKTQAQEDAAAFCASKGRQLKVVSLTDEKPLPTTGYVKAKIVFQALDASEVAAAPAVSAAPTMTAVERPAPPADVYNELLKLDELRKKGILMDEEFQSEKQKVLRRSK